VRKMVLIVSSIEPVDTLERWTFDIHHIDNNAAATPQMKSTKDINTEIAAVMRQVWVTGCECAFTLRVVDCR
jgi:hypothetical protein